MKEVIVAALAAAYEAGVRAGEVGIITPTIREREYALPQAERLIAALELGFGDKIVELAVSSWHDGAWGNPGVEHHPENEAAVRCLAGKWLRS